jgi:hypothetical protein
VGTQHDSLRTRADVWYATRKAKGEEMIEGVN